MKNLHQEIFELIEHNERLVQMAIVSIENGEEQSAKDIINTLYEIFLKIYSFRVTRSEKYNQLIEDTIPSFTPLALKYGFKDEVYNQSSFISTYRSGFLRIWYKSFEYDLWPISNFIVFKIQKEIILATKESKNLKIVNELLFLLSQLSVNGLERDGDRKQYYLNSPTFLWYFNIVLNSNDNEEFKVEYLSNFDNWFWNSIKRMVNYDSYNLFKLFVGTLFEGTYSKNYSSSPILDLFEYRGTQDEVLGRISNLNLEIRTQTNISDFNNLLIKINTVTDELSKNIVSGYSLEKVRSVITKDAEKCLKNNNLQIYIYLGGAYLVFKKKFDWIAYLWQFQQPSDADASWGSNSLLPSDLYSVFLFLLKEDSFRSRVEFSWEDHHGVSSYYKRYGLLLMARLFFIPRMNFIHDHILDTNILASNISSSDYEYTLTLCETLKRMIPTVRDYPQFRERSVNFRDEEIHVETALDLLLGEISSRTKEQKELRLNRSTFSDEDFLLLLDNINKIFLKESQLLRIFSSINCYSVEEEGNIDFNKVEILIQKPRREFIEQWNNLGLSVGYEAALNLVSRLNHLVISQINESSKEISKSVRRSEFMMFLESLPKLISDFKNPIILGFGIDLNELFWQSENFKASSEGEKTELVGQYSLTENKIDIYNLSNWSYQKFFFIVDSNSIGKLSLIKPIQRTGFQVGGFINASKNEIKGAPLMMGFAYNVFYRFKLGENTLIRKIVIED